MKAENSKSVLKRSIISSLVLVVFFILATGSIFLLLLIGIGMTKEYLGDGVYRETEVHERQHIKTEGKQDQYGKWDGWTTIWYSKKGSSEEAFTERVYMTHGVRQGLCTRTFPDGREEEDHYLNGIMYEFRKAAGSGPTTGSSFGLLQERTPWFLFAMEAFGFDNSYLEDYLDTAETLLYSFTFGPDEFEDYYSQVEDSLSQTPYDSIIQSNLSFSGSIGFRKMKDDQLRMAVIDRYRSGGASTFSILQSTYPNYIVEMNNNGVIGADLVQFCNVLDDSLDLMGGLDPEDPFFADSADSRYYVAVTSMMDSEKKTAVLSTGFSDGKTFRNLRSRFREARSPFHPEGIAATPSETAEIVINTMLSSFLDGDLIRQAVYESFLANAGIPVLPYVATQFASDNSSTSVTLNGTVTGDGGAEVTGRGIAWADYYNPSVDDHMEAAGTGTGEFSITLDGLTEGETYHARAYAINAAGTAYGNVITFIAGSTVGTGGNERGPVNLAVYPNPASSDIHIRFHSGLPATFDLRIYDSGGRMVLQHKTGDMPAGHHEIDLDVSGLPDGSYRCRLLREGIPLTATGLLIAR